MPKYRQMRLSYNEMNTYSGEVEGQHQFSYYAISVVKPNLPMV